MKAAVYFGQIYERRQDICEGGAEELQSFMFKIHPARMTGMAVMCAPERTNPPFVMTHSIS